MSVNRTDQFTPGRQVPGGGTLSAKRIIIPFNGIFKEEKRKCQGKDV
ncbi:MAG: hypothetical protein ACRC2T_07680 [Thermoguttaceae bacterium]